MTRKLMIFIRAPQAGQVKTRLAEAMGSAGALQAYETMLAILFNTLGEMANVELRFTPDGARKACERWLRPEWRLEPQGAGNLGEKLRRAFQESFDAGCERVVVIGSDCATLEARDIQAAWEALSTHDVVIGPARDGGYWLLGLRRTAPTLFDNIPWSTEIVFRQTLRRAREAGLTVHCLRELSDVDTLADWREFLRSRKQRDQ